MIVHVVNNAVASAGAGSGEELPSAWFTIPAVMLLGGGLVLWRRPGPQDEGGIATSPPATS